MFGGLLMRLTSLAFDASMMCEWEKTLVGSCECQDEWIGIGGVDVWFE